MEWTGYFYKRIETIKYKRHKKNNHINYCKIDGEIYSYNLWSDTDKHQNGYELIGYGRYHRSETIPKRDLSVEQRLAAIELKLNM